MKPTKLLLVGILGLFLIPNNIFAQKNMPTTNVGGKIFYKYTLLQGESLAKVAKKYNLKLADIYRDNPSARNGVKAGEVLFIPKSKAKIAAKKTTLKTNKKTPAKRVYTASQYSMSKHKVAKGETLFRISKKYKVSVKTIQQWNPKISNNRILPGQELIVGIGKRRASKRNTMRKKVAMRKNRKKTRRYRASSPTTERVEHKVKKGESLSVIAKKHKVSVSDLKKWNKLKNDKIKIGDILWVHAAGDDNNIIGVTPPQNKPDPLNVKKKQSNPNDNPIKRKYKSSNTSNDKGKITHIVQKSETLYKISRKYKVTVAEIKKWNKIKSSNYIKAGTQLVIYPKGYKTKDTNNTGNKKTNPILTTSNPTNNTTKKTSSGDNPLDFNGSKDKYEVDGKKKVNYQVKSGDNLWKIAQAHRVKMEEIKTWNNLRNTDDLVVGQTLKIYTKYPPKATITAGGIPKPKVDAGNPVKQSNDVFDLIRPGGGLHGNKPKTTPQKKVVQPKKKAAVATYKQPAKKVYKQPAKKVYTQPKTTAKRVTNTYKQPAKKIYRQPAVNTVKKKSFPPPPVYKKAVTKPKTNQPAAATTRPAMVINNPTRTTKTEVDKVMVFEKGMASMINVGQDSQKYQALHRSAPVGSFVRVTNLSNGKLVVVSVIGKLPEGTASNVIIKLTKRAYDQLKATEKVPVEIDYDLEKN